MTAHEALLIALVEAAAAGQRPPCGDYGDYSPWLSDDHRERAQAARLCVACPALDLCADAADETNEKFGVFGGVDRTPRPKGKPHMSEPSTPAEIFAQLLQSDDATLMPPTSLAPQEDNTDEEITE